MERNPEATCGTCPYWQVIANALSNDPRVLGECRFDSARHHPNPLYPWPVTDERDWCGRHPDFVVPKDLQVAAKGGAAENRRKQWRY